MRRTASMLAAAALCALSGVSAAPTAAPTTAAPTTAAPTAAPTGPTTAPTTAPTLTTDAPTSAPTATTTAPTDATNAPSSAPTDSPTTLITEAPTTGSPTTLAPTQLQPTAITEGPTSFGSTRSPTSTTKAPSTVSPTAKTTAPTGATEAPTKGPTKNPTKQPTKFPTNSPTISNGALQAQVCECQGNRKSSGLTRPFCDECIPGWVGTNCEVRMVPCTPARCSNHGTCDSLERCVCNIGFAGEFCETCASGFQGSSCEYNATTKALAACDTNSCMLNGTKNCLSGVPAALLAQSACGRTSCETGLCCSWKSTGHWQGATWIYAGEQHGTTCRASELEKCCGPGPVTPFGQDCVDEVYGKSCQAGYSACSKKHENGTSSATSATDISCCGPSQSCCDGACCDGDSTCATYDKDSHPASVLNNPNNNIPQYKCVKREDSGTISLYNIMIGALPMPAMAYFLFAFLAAMKLSLSAGLTLLMRINAFILFCICVGSVFAGGLWTMGVMVSSSLLVSMLCLQNKTKKWVWRALGIQLAALWVTMVAPMSTVVQDYYTTGVVQAWRVPLQNAAPSVNAQAMLTSMQACSKYYAYFHLDVALRSYDADFYPGANAFADGFDLYFGVCGYLFMTVIGMVLMALPVFLFVFMVQTLGLLMNAPEDAAAPQKAAAASASASSSSAAHDNGGGMEMQTMSVPTTNVPADYAGYNNAGGPPPVDHGWQELHTDEGVPYYFNSHSNVTTWEKPAELGGYPADSEPSPELTMSPLHT